MQKSARPSRINHESSGKGDFASVTSTFEMHCGVVFPGTLQLDLIQVVDAYRLSFADKEGIHVGSIPVRVPDGVMRTGGHQQLILTFRIHGGAATELMVIKSEAAFESTV